MQAHGSTRRQSICWRGAAAVVLAANAGSAQGDAPRNGVAVRSRAAAHIQPAGAERPPRPDAPPVWRTQALRTETPPRIDGRLDEDAWARAPSIEDFTQVDPVEGAAPTERTIVHLLFDADNLYFGLRAFDSEPDNVAVRELARDSDFEGSDRVAFVIDPFGQGRNGFYFEVNPGGAKRDGLIEDQTNIRFDWDGIWRAAARRTSEGWTAEVAIPFKTLSFDPAIEAWGFNVSRVIRRKTETVRWASPTRDRDLIALAHAGRLSSLEGLRQGLGLDVKPSLVLRSESSGSDFGDDLQLDPALDLFYKPDPELTAVLTLNTDFAEAEVDSRRVNLTRFPLFFPEKRDFFLQDAGIFEFGGIDVSPLPFFSRRIGISDAGRQRDILAGLKVTGRRGGVNFGMLHVLMKDEADIGQKVLSVGRASLDILEESSIGAIYTFGDPNARGENGLAGFDMTLRNSRGFGGGVLTARAWLQNSFSSGESASPGGDDELAFGAEIDYASDRFAGRVGLERIGGEFNPALGFVQRRDIRRYDYSVRRRWRFGSWLKRFDYGSGGQLITDLSGRLETFEWTPTDIGLESRAGDTFGGGFTLIRERLAEPFEIMEGVVIPPGTYDFVRGGFAINTSAARPVAAGFNIGAGGFFSGSRFDYGADLEIRASEHLFISAEWEQNLIDLPEGDFTVEIARARLNVAFSPRLTWSNLVQFDSVSETIGVNSRVQWIPTPGNEVFFVVNQGLDTSRGGLATLSTEISLKVGLTLRF